MNTLGTDLLGTNSIQPVYFCLPIKCNYNQEFYFLTQKSGWRQVISK